VTGWTVLAALLCLGTGLACLALATAGVGDRTAQLTHAVMGGAMAGMLSPWGDPLPVWLGAGGFAVLGAWFAATVLRGVRDDGSAVHLAISSAAMVLMYLTQHHTAAAGVPASGPDAGHAMSGGPTDLLVVPLALVLAGYFVWHTWACVDRARSARAAPCDSARATANSSRARMDVAASPDRVGPVLHGVMSALMAAMFLGAV
jgi:hypothetical protein